MQKHSSGNYDPLVYNPRTRKYYIIKYFMILVFQFVFVRVKINDTVNQSRGSQSAMNRFLALKELTPAHGSS